MIVEILLMRMTTSDVNDPVSHEIKEIALLPSSWYKREQTNYPLTASERPYEATKFQIKSNQLILLLYSR